MNAHVVRFVFYLCCNVRYKGGLTKGDPPPPQQLFCAIHYKALKRRDISGKTGTTDPGDEATITGSADLGKIVNLMQSV